MEVPVVCKHSGFLILIDISFHPLHLIHLPLLPYPQAIESFQLNTPLPIMSSQLAPPVQPDPFLSGTHPTRNLGSRSWTIDLCNRPHPYVSRPQTKGTLEVIQMSPAEDEAITSLLLLHHSSSCSSDESQRANVPRSPTPGCRATAQGPQPPGQSSSADGFDQSQEAISARSARAPEPFSLNGIITTRVDTRSPQKDCLYPGGVSFVGPPESYAELPPGSPEPTPELRCLPDTSPVAEKHGDLLEPGI